MPRGIRKRARKEQITEGSHNAIAHDHSTDDSDSDGLLADEDLPLRSFHWAQYDDSASVDAQHDNDTQQCQLGDLQADINQLLQEACRTINYSDSSDINEEDSEIECADSSDDEYLDAVEDLGGETLTEEETNDPVDNDVIVAMVVSLLTRHRLSGELKRDLVELINLLLFRYTGTRLNENQITTLVDSKKFKHEKHYYCASCNMAVTIEMPNCPNCDNNLNLDKARAHFLALPIRDQVETMLKRDEIYQYLKQAYQPRENCLGDIKDAQVYRELLNSRSEEERKHMLVSFLFTTDGVRVFKSSHLELWPVYVAVNEIPISMRFRPENLVLAGVWVSPHKPHMLTYLRPMFEELQTLGNGVPVDTAEGKKSMQCFVLGVTCDLPARATCLSMIMFNGALSCHKCLEPGQTEKSGKKNAIRQGSVHCYKHKPAEKRTDASFRADGELALHKQELTNGIKGPCIFSYLPRFSVTRGIGVDALHALFIGLFKALMTLWFTAAYKKEKFSVYTKADELDKRIKALKPPVSIKHAPRCLDDLKHFKGAEYAGFILLYLPMFWRVLPDEYFIHLSHLSHAIVLLYKHKITGEDLRQARMSIGIFCEQFENLYSLRLQTTNFHNIGQHLVDDVQNLGPLWCFDTFEFESMYGKILKLIHGNQSVDMQVVKVVSTLQNLPQIVKAITDPEARGFCEKLMGHRFASKEVEIEPGIFSMGTVTKVFGEEETTLLERGIAEMLGYAPLYPVMIKGGFLRLRKLQNVFHCREYTRVHKRNSFTCSYFDANGARHFCFLLKFYTIEFVNGDQQKVTSNVARIRPIKVLEENVGEAFHCKVVEKPSAVKYHHDDKLILMSRLDKLCVYMKFDDINQGFISLVPNLTRVA